MKRLLLIPFCLALGLAALVAGPAAGRGGSHHARGVTVIEHATTDVTTDTGEKGDSVGDLLTFANAVFDAKDAKQVGTDQGYCVRVVAGAAYECNWTVLLPKGNLVVEGPFYDAKDSTLAITGGTGAYARARGTMRLHALEGGTKYRFSYHPRG